MALYKFSDNLKQSTDAAFDQVHNPGADTPHSGIYRCTNCGKEVASNAGNPLPPQNHDQHSTNQGAIRWKLLVYAVY